jgi:superfamily II DNA or RNA helicase
VNLPLFNLDDLPDVDAPPDGLRYYQEDARAAVLKSLETNRSTLAVMATGTGKTQLFSAIAKHWPGSVLVLAHRKELVDQARKRLEQMTGEWVEVEQADRKSYQARLVVGSIDTVRKQKRLENLGRDRFQLLVMDEAHHYCGNTYVRPFNYFAGAKAFGVTATPDRADEKALGQVFDDVAYVMDIGDGISAGYLVPLRATSIHLSSVDLSAVGKTGKDLAAGALDTAMLKGVEGIVKETIAIEPERLTIAFFPGVKTARYAAERFNALQPESARFVSAETPPDERDQIFRDFRAGKFLRLCNCQIVTEGVDVPPVSCIALGRPTLSRALYAQMVGRGSRTLAPVDSIPGEDGAVARRQLIALSQKPDCHILDFKGNAGKHSLIGPEDVLGGKYTDEEVKLAKKKQTAGGDITAALEAARQELALLRERALSLRSRVTSTRQIVNPFGVLHIDTSREDAAEERFGFSAATDNQRRALLKFGLLGDELRGLSKGKASKLLATAHVRAQKGLATYAQLRKLREFGVDQINISRARASSVLDYIASTGWGRTEAVDPHKVQTLLKSRVVGEEG